MNAREAGESEFVVRAGMATLLSVGALEKRSVLRRLLWEASKGQQLREHISTPREPELEPGHEEEDEEPEVEEPEDDEFEEVEEPEDEFGAEEADDAQAGAELEPDAGPTVSAAPAGIEALAITGVVERWLRASPHGALGLGRAEASDSVVALGIGWASTVVHALAREPLSLDELDRAIDFLSAGELRGFLEPLEKTGLVEARTEDGETRYSPTRWLRQGVAPIVIGARHELRHPRRGIAPIERLDVEAAFLLALPLLELSAGLSGAARLGVELGGSGRPTLAGVTVVVENGRIASVSPGLDEGADAWAVGSNGAWLETVIEPGVNRVAVGGEGDLSRALIGGLHEALFGDPG